MTTATRRPSRSRVPTPPDERTLMATTLAAEDAPDYVVMPDLTVRQLNRMRVGYLVVGLGLAVVKWPLLIDGRTWELKEGIVNCVLAALGVLALLGLRHPRRMLPVMLFEVAWKSPG